MSEDQDRVAHAEDPESDPDEPQLIPPVNRTSATNTTYGHQFGTQAGIIHGNVLQNVHLPPDPKPPLVVRRITGGERDEAVKQFVTPDGFPRAQRCLSERRVAALCRPGSGRTCAARRLLLDCGATDIAEINPARPLGSIREQDWESGHGYIWDASDAGERPFSDRDFNHCTAMATELDCWLVVILNTPDQAASAAVHYTVELRPPDPVSVALAAINYQWSDAPENRTLVLKDKLADTLGDGAPPDKARHAAHLAIQVTKGDKSSQEALAELRYGVQQVVALWFRKRTVREYSMALAVAVLEHEPYDEVVTHAHDLDERIRTAESPTDRTLRPRQVFDKPREQLLREVQAVLVARPHPRHSGLQEETVRFERQDWAAAVLRHAWREYPSLREVLTQWLCRRTMLDRFPDAARQAVCILVAETHTHEPLWLVNSLAARNWSARRLAAATLVRLADDHGLSQLVRRTLHNWAVAYDEPSRQSTAATVYSSPFGRRDIRQSLDKLGTIGRSSRSSPQNAVVSGLIGMLRDPDVRELVLDTVVQWSQQRHQRTGLRWVALGAGLWIAGVFPDKPIEVSELTGKFHRQASTLFHRALLDPDFGTATLSRLSELRLAARFDPDAVTELVRLTTLIAPDLRWWSRRRAVADVLLAHPARRSEVLRVFREARKAQRLGRSTDARR